MGIISQTSSHLVSPLIIFFYIVPLGFNFEDRGCIVDLTIVLANLQKLFLVYGMFNHQVAESQFQVLEWKEEKLRILDKQG